MLKHFRLGVGLGLTLLLVTGAGCATITPPSSPNTSPEDDDTPAAEGWETTTDTGVTFAYPGDMDKTYIDAPDWPPQIQVMNQGYTCLEAGDEESVPGGQTEERVINGDTYCVTTESDAGAGNYYSMYSYAFPKDDKTVIMSFSIHTVQCQNYDEPEQSACQDEQSDLDIDELVNDMVETLRWANS